MADQCSAHEYLMHHLNDIREKSDMRDEEQESAIRGLSTRMEDMHRDIRSLEDRFDELEEKLPNIIATRITGYIDQIIVTAVKGFWKWFVRAILGGALITITGLIVRSFF